MRKEAFYAIVGGAIILTAIALGYSAARIASARGYAPPSPPPAKGSRPSPQAAPDPPPERWTNVFAPAQGMEIPTRIARAAGAAPMVRTNFVLLGTIDSDSASTRRAILWADGLKEPRLFREKAEIEPGVFLAHVARDHVMLEADRKRERLDLLPVGSKSRGPAQGQAAAPAGEQQPAGPPIRVSQIRTNVYGLDQAAVAQLTGNINQFMTQVRIVPYFEGEKSAGYRLAAIRPGSAFEQLGFRGGDVIQQVNNLDISSPDKLYTIFQNLKDEKRVTVNVLRQGAKDTLTYEIR